MHFVYIIHSPGKDRYYVGESVNAVDRVKQHNAAFYNSASTSYARDWEIELLIKTDSRSDALLIEKHIKKMKSKKYIHRLCLDNGFQKIFETQMNDQYGISIQLKS